MRWSIKRRTAMPNKHDEKNDKVVLVHPQTGEEIPTVSWVAENLLKQGWTKAKKPGVTKEEKKTQSTLKNKEPEDNGTQHK